MNPHLCRVALRPRSPFEVFDLTLRLIRERAGPLAWMSLYVLLPTFLIGWAVGYVLVGNSPALLLLPVLAGPLVQAPFTVLGGRLLFQEHVSAGRTLRDTARIVGGLLITVLAEVVSWVLVCTGIGMVLLPGLVYLPEMALLERVDLGRGVQRSLRLAGGQVGVAVVGALSRWGLMVWGALVGELAGQLLVGFVLQLGAPFGSLFDGVATPYAFIGLLLCQPLVALFRLLLYVDVRTRMEGWDLQVGLRALGLAAGEARP